ncbi:MAG: phosphatidylglycerol lysyltransferase [Treponema sp.]|nr:phosphatidylglycerol lysyltransferase [Treponema sp.]
MQLTKDDPGLRDAALSAALSAMILSASGWRAIFAPDGNEENPQSEISPAHSIIVAVAAKVFADYVKKTTGVARPALIVGMDARPTGKSIADVMMRSLTTEGCAVRWTGITAAPEIMAFARSEGVSGRTQGFVYISASHNPIGHNGLKFGLTDGGVLAGSESKLLIEAFRSFLSGPGRIEKALFLINGADQTLIDAAYDEAPRVKQEALSAYRDFTREVVSAVVDKTEQEKLFADIKRTIQDHPIGVIADFNGSARAVSIDREFLPSLGVKFAFINGEAGNIAHRIVPEGESLDCAAQFLEERHARDPAFVMGYMPDCDGDRGNIVIWDESLKRVRALEAQEVFALACVAELSHLVWTGSLRCDENGRFLDDVAVVVNDPTSLRIDGIAMAFGAKLFRAEVGEANVVSLARRLRGLGCTVRILGEGSAGGNITHPSAVRDPIDTVFALLKMLAIRSAGDKKGLFEIWRDLSGNIASYKDDFTLSDIIKTLPFFVSTGGYTQDALLKVKSADHAILKERYQKIFSRDWENKKEHLYKQYGIVAWKAACYNGVEERCDIKNFGEAGRGGLKILFIDDQDARVASLWMRGSGTEPVFRIMADAECFELERELIAWQRAMVIEADNE